MNGIDDLRSTLEAHAGDVSHDDPAVRRAAVQRRIGVARRRRQLAASGAVAAVVAVIGAVAVLPGDDSAGPEPAGPRVFGVDLPRELDSLGYAYDYQDHVSGDGHTVLRLPASDRPRLVSWATATSDRVEVSLGGAKAQVHDGADFTDWSYVAPGDGIDVAATASDGGVALAVYVVGDSRPDGTTADGVTFRRTRAGAPLLGATIGAPGQSEVVVVPTARAAGVFYAFYCAGGPPDSWVHLAGAAGEVLQGGCDDTVPLDAAAGGGTSVPVRPGEDLTTRFYVTEGRDGPRVVAGGLRIGLGLYAEPQEQRPGRGIALPEAVEHDGHAWRLVTSDVPDVTDEGAVAQVPELDGRLLVLAQSRGSDGARVTTAVDGVRGDSVSTLGGTFTLDLPAGARRVAMIARGGDPLSPRAAFGFGFYVRAD